MKRRGLVPAAKDERYSCSVRDSAGFRGSGGQYSAKLTSVPFLIHEAAGGLVQMKVQPLVLSEHDSIY